MRNNTFTSTDSRWGKHRQDLHGAVTEDVIERHPGPSTIHFYTHLKELPLPALATTAATPSINVAAVSNKGRTAQGDVSWKYMFREQTEEPVIVWRREVSKEQVITLREGVSRHEAKAEIRRLFDSSSDPLDYGDMADSLRLDLKLVVEACSELIEEGTIEFA